MHRKGRKTTSKIATLGGALSCIVLLAIAGKLPVAGKEVAAAAGSSVSFNGNASWYGAKFHGKRTASGRPFDMNKLTAAHRSLPFGTRVLVENPRNGQSVVVEVIDRGPFTGRRVMDLSREAARRLGILLGGVAYVECLVVAKETTATTGQTGPGRSN